MDLEAAAGSDGRRLDLAAAPRGVGNGGGQLDRLAFLFFPSYKRHVRVLCVRLCLWRVGPAGASVFDALPACLDLDESTPGWIFFTGTRKRRRFGPDAAYLFSRCHCSVPRPPPFSVQLYYKIQTKTLGVN